MIDPTTPPATLLEEAIQPPSHAAVHAATRQLLAVGALSGPLEGATTTTVRQEERPPAALRPAPAALHPPPCTRRPECSPASPSPPQGGLLLASLPVSVPLGRLLLLGEALGLAREASVIAASLSLPDPFLQPYTKGDAAKDAKAPAHPAAGAEGAKAAAGAVAAADMASFEEEAKHAKEDVAFFKPRLGASLRPLPLYSPPLRHPPLPRQARRAIRPRRGRAADGGPAPPPTERSPSPN